jgi:hypothetical protein
VIISGLYALLFYKPFQKYKVFFWSFVFTLAVFIFFKAKDYYVIGLYPIYIAFGSVFGIDSESRLEDLVKTDFNYAACFVFHTNV